MAANVGQKARKAQENAVDLHRFIYVIPWKLRSGSGTEYRNTLF